MRIVELLPEHLDDAARLVASLPLYQSYGLSESGARKGLASGLDDERAVMLAAVDGADLLGVAWFVRRGCFDRSGYLKQIAVSDAAQGRGVGKKLLGELEHRHLAEGGIVLMVTSSNTGARGFYERLGYTRVGEIAGYVRQDKDECVYWKGPGGLATNGSP